ncbi:MAG: J domain-containing protein [Nodosilinea sp.]
MAVSCYSIVHCEHQWFWAAWRDLGCCWFADAEPFAYGRAKTSEQAIADARDASGLTAVQTHGCFAAEWKASLDRRKRRTAAGSRDARDQTAYGQSPSPKSPPNSGTHHQTRRPPASTDRSKALPLRQLEQTYAAQLRLLALTVPFTRGQLNDAYRKRARETHPDQGGTPEAFMAIAAAYQRLKAIADLSITAPNSYCR